MYSARVPVVFTQKRYKEVAITEDLFMARPLDWSANTTGAALPAGQSRPDSRQYLLMSTYQNEGVKPATLTPVIYIHGNSPGATLEASRTSFSVATNTHCWTSCAIESFHPQGTNEASLALGKIMLAPGAQQRWVLAINRNDFPQGTEPVNWTEAETLRGTAIKHWEHDTALPYDVIHVPDPEIQALLETSVRELYQMRYIIHGLPAYFFGPGNYNDYWVLDGFFVTEAMDMLGRVEDADGYTDYLLLHQQPDGRIQCMGKHWKETGIALLTLDRHAQLIQNKAWLLSRWLQIVRGFAAIQQLRQTGDAANPKALNYRLSPEGFGDGGVRDGADFTNNHWLLAGLKAAIAAAKWLGKEADARARETQYCDFRQVFQQAIERDAKTDGQGNRYIPAVMGLKTPLFPTRGQWAFCHGVYPGGIFAPDDPLMLGTLKMLQAHEVQGGIVENSGWNGIWAQIASFYGHDWLWLGNGRKASDLLYAFANHASPLRNFREEMRKQSKPGEKFSYAQGSGDMPHVSAAAEFIRLTGHLLAFDRGTELHLLEGMPAAWLQPGMAIRLNGLGTPFGPFDPESANCTRWPDRYAACGPLERSGLPQDRAPLGLWSARGARPTQELTPNEAHELTLTVPIERH